VKTNKSGRTSSGILLWRRNDGRLEVLLAHQGGPFWAKKDLGHWTIPKGEVEPGEEFEAVARREFAEETGHDAPDQPLIALGEITQKSGKLVLGWAVEGSGRRPATSPDPDWAATTRILLAAGASTDGISLSGDDPEVDELLRSYGAAGAD